MFDAKSHDNGRFIVLDVRGTLLDGQQDAEISQTLLQEIVYCLQDNIAIALLSGCSRHTIDQLIFLPWRIAAQSDARFVPGIDIGFYVYTENGCRGYKVDADLYLSELEDYPSEILDETVKKQIYRLLTDIADGLGLNAEIQSRSGQMNFYLDATYSKRVVLAKMFSALLRDANLPLNVVTPTSKDVIDISVRAKTDALADILLRLGISSFTNVLAVSDSFQIGGADYPIVEALTGARLVHVGPTDLNVPDNVLITGGGPQGTSETIASWRQTPLSNVKFGIS